MANTGYKWGAWGSMQKGAGNWTADALADGATETGDATSLDLKAACEIGIKLTQGVGAPTGEATIYVLGDAGGLGYETTTEGSPWAFNITPKESGSVYKRFMVDPAAYGGFKIAVENQGGFSLDVSIEYRTADWPVAA